MMNPPKCDDLDYIQFLIAAQKSFTCTEAARCHPEGEDDDACMQADQERRDRAGTRQKRLEIILLPQNEI